MSSSSSSTLLMSSSSSTSTEFMSSTSSSYEDAVTKFFFVDKNGDVYRFLSDDHHYISSLVFKNFSSITGVPSGLALSYYFDEESSSSSLSSLTSASSLSSTSETSSSLSGVSSVSEISSESSSSPSESESSLSTISYNYNFYILRKKSATVSNVSIYSESGVIRDSIDFTTNLNFLGMTAYPDNSNLLIAISSDYFNLFTISNGQIGVTAIRSPVELSNGISFKEKISQTESDFYVCEKDTGQILTVRIDIQYRLCSIIDYRSYKYSIGGIKGISKQDEGYDFYTIVEKEPAYSYVYLNEAYSVRDSSSSSSSPSQTSELTSGYEKFKLLSTMPFSIYGMTHGIRTLNAVSIKDINLQPSITVRSYDVDLGAMVETNNVFLGNVINGKKSNFNIVNIKVNGANLIDNLRVGIVASDISAEDINKVFMIETSNVIDLDMEMEHYFPGLNNLENPDSSYNVPINVKRNLDGSLTNESEYIYFSVNVPEKYIGRGYFVLKWFFEYQ